MRKSTGAQGASLFGLLLAVVSGCSSGGNGGGSPAETCDLPASQTISQPCCASLGVDACGAGLFCAAFDGRQQATCYAERSRADQTECSADVQCLSGSCNTTAAACRSLQGTACSSDVGCAPAVDNSRFACSPGTQTCLPIDPNDGGLCEQNDDCNSHHCVAGRCESGGTGSPCGAPSDCNSNICQDGTCSDGGSGAKCSGNEECSVGTCIGGSCSTGQLGQTCTGASDCASSAPHCVAGKCSRGDYGDPCATNADCSSDARYCGKGKCGMGWADDPCDDASDCAPQYPKCNAGKCYAGKGIGESCTQSSECAKGQSDLGKTVATECDTTKRTCVISLGGKCDYAWDSTECTSGHSCQPDEANPGQCEVENTPCSGSYCYGCVGPNCSASWSCYDGWSCQ
ncbi:MAG: hypothetical protein AB7K71_09530 [Polyangiaceae bacterium]